MATPEETRLVLQIEANVKSLERAMKQSGALVDKTTEAMNDNFRRLGPTVDRQMKQIEASTRNATRNLGFQFQDISTQLLSGQSPFTIAAQQSAQAGDAISELSRKGGLLKGIGSALAATFSPAAIGVGAAILAFGALTQALQTYFSTTGDEADKASKEIEAQQAEIRAIGERWKDTFPAVKAYTDELLRASEATQLIADKQKLIAQEMQPAKDVLKEFSADIAAVRTDLQAADFEQFGPLGDAISTAFGDLQQAIANGKDPSDQIKRLQEAILAAQKSQVQSAIDLAAAFNTTVMPVLNRVQQKANEIKQAFQDTSNPISGYSIGPGGMGMAGADQAMQIRAQADAINSASAELIRAEEGFITAAKWDENHFRVGFGSDTYVDELGKVQEVTKDTVITLAQANADLGRRIGEFQRTIVGQIGPEMWRSLEEGQKAALTSIAYNYGDLPSSIVKAIKQGDRGQVAAAIASLSANPERRKREAQVYGGGRVAGMDQERASAEALYATNQRLIEQARAELQINSDLNLTRDQKTIAIETERNYQELLNAAQRDGVTITTELMAKYREQAATMAELGVQSQALATNQASYNASQEQSRKQAAQLGQQYSQIAQSGLRTFISELQQGKSAGDAFRASLQNIINSLIDLTLQQMFATQGFQNFFQMLGGFGGGGQFGIASSGGIGLYHSGGKVGGGGAKRGGVNPLIFAGAPRLHNGLMAGEYPAILQAGEQVIPKNMVGKKNAAYVDQSSTYFGDISVDVSTGQVVATTEEGRALGDKINLAVQKILVAEGRPGGLLRTRQ